MHCLTIHNTGRSQWQKYALGICLFILCVAAIFFIFQTHQPSLPQTTTSAVASDSSITYNEPLVITDGGTYTGNWESKDTEVPAVEVKTSEPVTIINSNIRGAGYLIKSWGYGADITIRNTNGYGLTPTPWSDYEKPRRFLALDVFRNVVVENCYMENTAGIYLGVEYVGNHTPANTIKIRYNKAKNIDGRIYGGTYRVQFVQFNFRGGVKHAEIAWNQIINEPGNSAVEDNINIYNSKGTPDSPILIHNNFIKGAYPYPADSTGYTGGGILIDSPSKNVTNASAYVRIYDNQLVGLGNHCIGIAGGNNIEICNNRAIVAAQFKDGTYYPFWTGGIWAKDYYKNKTFFDNQVHHNTLAVTGQTGTWRNDISDSIVFVTKAANNISLPGKVTKEMENQEFELWKQKLKLAGLPLGPQKAQL